MFTPGEKVGSFLVVARLWTRPGSITFLGKREKEEGGPLFVAIESLDRAANDDSAKRDVFLERGRGLATAKLSGIPAVLEMGEEKGTAWVAREFVDGVTLGQLIAALSKRRRRLSEATAGAIILRAARALTALKQSASVDHGGLDADRILIGFDGRVAVVGFLGVERTGRDEKALGEAG